MFARALHALFRFATTRAVLLALGLALALLAGAMLLEQWRFVRDFQGGEAAVREAEGIVDGLAGLLVAAGVFLESRDAVRAIAHPGGAPSDTVEARVSEVCAQNGMGVLLVGLLMEVGTLLIGLPKRVLDTHGLERAIFGACAALTALTLLILYDFVKDVALTYRMTRTPAPPPAPRGH
jgi:hypothetical protein